ncbi:hypothetical protein FACS18942_07320 [Planctomycetales bacterium]|nr:hypothetical protein FACS18942_07320 [Planctomycetales bacterium]GHT38104.1 hypothetical protein FACS189427_11950 [Planctomycetales bacterium]
MKSQNLFLTASACIFFTAVITAGQETPPQEKADWEIQRDLYPARKTVQGRFGEVQFGTLTPKFDYSRQRLQGAGVFGSNNRILGLDTMSGTSRIRPQSVDEAAAPSRSAQDEPVKYKVAPSANTVAPAAADLSRTERFRTQPANPNFFEQPGIMDITPADTPENRQPIEQRWFRDIDAMNDTGANNTGTNNIGRNSAVQPADKNGLAVAVGGIQDNTPPASRTNSAANPQFAPRPQYVSPRNFERQLEEMLITNPGIQLLSPVQVTYQNGTATVRGVVANQQNKVEAGKVLLTAQGVRQVNNQLTVVPLDPVRLPVIEAK